MNARLCGILFFCSAFSAASLHAADPCAPREFVGRIVIIFNGAGERSERDEAPFEAIDANAALKAFIGDSPVLVPSVVFSSDPKVTKGERLSSLRKTGAVGVFEASKQSWERVFSATGYLSKVKQRLGANKVFKSAIKPGEDISRYLKIEIVIVSHSATDTESGKFRGLPIWNFDGERGTNAKHIQHDGPVLTQADFQPLYSIFPNAIVQSFILSCHSSNVGELIGPDAVLAPNVCYCSAGMVDRDLKAPIRGGLDPKNGVDDERSVFGVHLLEHSTNGNWEGSQSLYSLNLSTLDYYRSYARIGGSRGNFTQSMFAVNPSVTNPYESFATTSLDTLVGTLSATSNAPTPRKVRQDPVIQGLLADLGQLFKQWETEKRNQAAIPNRLARFPKTFFKMQTDLRRYMDNCFKNKTEFNCLTVNRMIQKAELQGKPMSSLLRKIDTDIDKFADQKAYSIGEQDSRIPLKAGERERILKALKEIHENWVAFTDFLEIIYDTGDAEGDLSAAGRELTTLTAMVASFHQSFLHAYYPDLVRASLEKRALTARNAVENIMATEGRDESMEKIQRIRDQLNCLTNVPMGPAFDEKYILPKLLNGKTRAASGERIYLLPQERNP